MTQPAARALATACLVLAAASPDLHPGLAADDRSTERFRYLCSNDLGRREVTLFANGTVRLREGLWDSQEMYLDELTPEELASTLRRLAEVAAGESAGDGLPTEVVAGEWVERCEIRLALAESEIRVHVFSPFEILPLAVAGLIHVAEDLAELTRPLRPPVRLPADYRPQTGDVLRTAEGERFEVVRRTVDGRGVELRGLDSPLQLFVDFDDLDQAFVAREPLVGRDAGGRSLDDRAPANVPLDGGPVRGMSVDVDDDEKGPDGRTPGGGSPASQP